MKCCGAAGKKISVETETLLKTHLIRVEEPTVKEPTVKGHAVSAKS